MICQLRQNIEVKAVWCHHTSSRHSSKLAPWMAGEHLQRLDSAMCKKISVLLMEVRWGHVWGLHLLSLLILYSKGKVFELTSSSGSCCATWSGQKGLVPSTFHFISWCQHHSFQTKWAKEILWLHMQEHTLLQCIGGEVIVKSWASAALFLHIKIPGHHTYLSLPALWLYRSDN